MKKSLEAHTRYAAVLVFIIRKTHQATTNETKSIGKELKTQLSAWSGFRPRIKSPLLYRLSYRPHCGANLPLLDMVHPVTQWYRQSG